MKIHLLFLFVILTLIFLNMIIKKPFPKFNSSKPTQPIITKEKLRYLDQFYIQNRLYTYSMVIFYLCGYLLPIVTLRALSLGQTTSITNQSHLFLSLLETLIQLSLIIMIWILYTNLIYKIAAIEINKFFLRLISTDKLANLIRNVDNIKPLKFLIVFIRVFTYRASGLSFHEHLYPIEHGSTYTRDNVEYELFYLDDEIIYLSQHLHKKYIKTLMFLTMSLVRKSLFFGRFLYKLSRIMYFFYRHIDNFTKKLPLALFIFIFIFEIYNKEIYFTYFIGSWLYILNLKKQFYTYYRERNSTYDRSLGAYFYFNSHSYKNQRESFMVEGSLTKLKIYDSRQNAQLYHVLDKLIEYASVYEFNEENHRQTQSVFIRHTNRLKMVDKSYTRFFVVIFLIICLYFSSKILYLSNITQVALVLILIYMIYLQAHIYYMKANNAKPFTMDKDIGIEEFIYNKTNNRIFWTLAIPLLGFFFFILLKPQLTILNSEIIFNLPPFTVVKVFSAQDKMLYLFQIFEFYLSSLSEDALNKDYLRYLLRITMQNETLDSSLTLKDIQVFVKLFIENYFFNEISQQSLCTFVSNDMPLWLNAIKSIILVGALVCTIAYYENIFKLIITLQTTTGRIFIGKQLTKMAFKKYKINISGGEEYFNPFKHVLTFVKILKDFFFW